MYISPSCGGGARRRVGALSCSGGGGPVPSPNSRQDVPPPTPPPIPAAWRARGVVRQPAQEQGRGEGGMSRAPAAAETGRGGRARAAEVPDDPPTPSRHRGDPRQRPRRGAAATAHRRAVGSGRASAPAPHTPPVKAPATSPTRPRKCLPPPPLSSNHSSPRRRAGLEGRVHLAGSAIHAPPHLHLPHRHCRPTRGPRPRDPGARQRGSGTTHTDGAGCPRAGGGEGRCQRGNTRAAPPAAAASAASAAAIAAATAASATHRPAGLRRRGVRAKGRIAAPRVAEWHRARRCGPELPPPHDKEEPGHQA